MAAIAQLGERQTEDLQVPGSIPGLGSGMDLAAHVAYLTGVLLICCVGMHCMTVWPSGLRR